MLLYELNVKVLDFYVLKNSVWLDSLFFIYFSSAYVSLHLEENKSTFKALES